MNLLPAQSTGNLGEKQRKALISLLADDDPAVYQTVRNKIISCGPVASEWLKEFHLTDDFVLRRRVNEILDHFGRQSADTRFLAFCLNQGEDFDLEQSALLLAQTQYPGINTDAYRALLDEFAGELRERLDLNGNPATILAVINDYLYRELGFSGNGKDYYNPENSYINRVIDRRAGNRISLSLIYLLLARRLRLPMAGIGLPGHFLCRYQSSTREIFVDAFHQGKLLTKTDCVRLVMQWRQSFEESCLAPVSPRRILLRICADLQQIYSQLKAPAQTERLHRYLVALAK